MRIAALAGIRGNADALQAVLDGTSERSVDPVINPSSVGCAAYDGCHSVPHVVQTGYAGAAYGLIEKCADGWQVDIRLIAYKTCGMAAMAQSAWRPGWAAAIGTGWLQRFRFLLKSRVANIARVPKRRGNALAIQPELEAL